MKCVLNFVLAVLLPPLGLFLAGGLSLAFWIALALFVAGQAVYWGVMAGPGLLLWGLSMGFGGLAVLWGGLRGGARSTTLHCRPGLVLIGLLLVAGCRDEAADLDPAAVARGEEVFTTCAGCHGLQEGRNMIGPSLAGIVGERAGEVANYDYTEALAAADLTWTPETLTRFLLDPEALVPGTAMASLGLTEQEAADVVTFLQSED